MKVDDIYTFTFHGYEELCICVRCLDGLKLEAKKLSSNNGPYYVDPQEPTLKFIFNKKDLEELNSKRGSCIKKMIKNRNEKFTNS